MQTSKIKMIAPPTRSALVIEDDPFFCRIFQHFLAPWNLEIVTVATVAGARSLMAQRTFDLYIVDFQLSDDDSSNLLSDQISAGGPASSRSVIVTSFPLVASSFARFPTVDKRDLVALEPHLLKILGSPEQATSTGTD